VSNIVPDAERLRRLQLLTDAALAHLQLDELLDALLDRTRDLLGVDTCAVLLLDEERTSSWRARRSGSRRRSSAASACRSGEASPAASSRRSGP
jgi:hypothetical protein